MKYRLLGQRKLVCLSLFITDHCKETQQKKSMVTHTHSHTHTFAQTPMNLCGISLCPLSSSLERKRIFWKRILTKIFDLRCCMPLGLVCIVEQYLGQVDPRPRKVRFSKKKDCLSRTSGLGSHNNEQIDNKTLEIVNAGDQLLRRISRQIAPLALIFGW